MMDCQCNETFFTLLLDLPHWEFETFLTLLIDGLVIGMLWPLFHRWLHEHRHEKKG